MSTFHRTTGQAEVHRFWQAHIESLARSGCSRSAYCRQHRLSYHALTYWLRKQSQPVMQAAPLLSLVEVPAHVLPASAPFRLSIGGEYLVELDAAFDEAALSLPELLARFGTEEQYRQELFHLMAGSA